MQTNQHASNHPVRIRKTERAPDNDGYADASENESRSQHEDSFPPDDSERLIMPSTGRRPARADENTTRYRR